MHGFGNFEQITHLLFEPAVEVADKSAKLISCCQVPPPPEGPLKKLYGEPPNQIRWQVVRNPLGEKAHLGGSWGKKVLSDSDHHSLELWKDSHEDITYDVQIGGDLENQIRLEGG